jgi:hypothetical protein
MDLTIIKAPKGQEELKDALGNYIYAQPDNSLESKLKPEALSKKELREKKKKKQEKQVKKNAQKPKPLEQCCCASR